MIRVLVGVALLLAAGCAAQPSPRVVTLTGACRGADDEASANVCAGFLVDLLMTTQFGAYEDDELASYVSEVGRRLVAAGPAAELEFTFRVLDEPRAQAWAAPGGFVYVTRGLLAQLSSEAQLAAVLAHEIGHVLAGHTDRLWGGLPDTVANELGSPRLTFDLGRDEERHADHLALVLIEASGYDPRAVARMLEALAPTQGRLEGESWASRHPPLRTRIARVTRSADGRRRGRRLRRVYAQQLDGLVVGADPRRGHVANGQLVYPRAGFAIDLPAGFRVADSARPAAESGDEARHHELLVQPVSSAAFLSESDEPTPLERRQVGGFDVVIGRPEVLPPGSGQGASRRRHVAVFETHDGASYAIVTTGLEDSQELLAAFEGIVSSLHSVPPDAGPAPLRLHAVVVEEMGTLASLASTHCGEVEEMALLERVNGARATREMVPGEVLKCFR